MLFYAEQNNSANAMTESEDLYQIALLIDQLKHDDVQLRLTASKSTVQIARALGAERTRNELIPFLTESCNDEDDVLVVIAEKLGEMVNCVGGDEHCYLLLVPLESLVSGEEASVRNAAINSIEMVVNRMPANQLVEYFIPLLNKLASKDWFTSRGSAAALSHLCFGKLPSGTKRDVEILFLKLCADDTPFVRRLAAQSLVKFVNVIESGEKIAPFVEAFKKFAGDDQDSIRIQVVPIGIAYLRNKLAKTLPEQVLPTILQIANDRSWRVRWSLTNHLHQILQYVVDSSSEQSLANVYDSLLNDSEPEVRAAAASQLNLVCKHFQKSIILAKIVPTCQRMVTDPSEFVRAFFALEINHLALYLGKESTVQLVLPMLLHLLRDDTSEVRLNVISSLDSINSTIGVELLSQSLLPAIVDLAQDHKWRVRLAIIEHIPMLAKQLGVGFFNEKLISLCMSWLSDDVYSIRKAAAEAFRKLTDLFGNDWCRDHIIPKIEKMHSNTSFAQRLTALHVVQVIFPLLTRAVLEASVVPLILTMSSDTVPNIRFTVAKTLHMILPFLQKANVNLSSCSSTLVKLSQDSDRDVKFYANKAIQENHVEVSPSNR